MRSCTLASVSLASIALVSIGCGGLHVHGPGSHTFLPAPAPSSAATTSPPPPPRPASAIRALVFDESLVHGGPRLNELGVYVSDSTLANIHLLVDTGQGYKDAGVQFTAAGTGFAGALSAAVPPTARLQVTATKNGAPVSSAPIPVSNTPPTPITVSAPQTIFATQIGSFTPGPFTAGVKSVAWLDTHVSDYMVFLSVLPSPTNPAGNPNQWIVSVPGSETAWAPGSSTQDTFATGPTSLVGNDELTVLGFDANGWGVATSTDSTGADLWFASQ
jgi:hypothetical protein